MLALYHLPSRSIPFLLMFVIMGSSYAEESLLYTPQPEHKLLKRFAGDWQFIKKSVPEVGDPESIGSGEISAEMLGDFFVISKWRGEVYDAEFTAVQTLGFDAQKKKYTGAWTDSIMSHLWQIEGSAAVSGKKMTLLAKGPSPGGEITTFREIYEFKSQDSITVVAEMMLEDGKWVAFMTTDLSRKTNPR